MTDTDPSARLGSLRARQRNLLDEVTEVAGEIDREIVRLVGSGASQAEIARLAGLSRQEVSRRVRRAAR